MKFPHAFAPARHEQTEYAADCIAKIRDMLAHPKPAGKWWAKEIMSKVAAGQPVGILAYEMAKSAIGPVPERIPGEDDE